MILRLWRHSLTASSLWLTPSEIPNPYKFPEQLDDFMNIAAKCSPSSAFYKGYVTVCELIPAYIAEKYG